DVTGTLGVVQTPIGILLHDDRWHLGPSWGGTAVRYLRGGVGHSSLAAFLSLPCGRIRRRGSPIAPRQAVSPFHTARAPRMVSGKGGRMRDDRQSQPNEDQPRRTGLQPNGDQPRRTGDGTRPGAVLPGLDRIVAGGIAGPGPGSRNDAGGGAGRGDQKP